MDRSRKPNSEGNIGRTQFQSFLVIIEMEVSKDDPKMFGFRGSFQLEGSIKLMSCSYHFNSSELETTQLSFG